MRTVDWVLASSVLGSLVAGLILVSESVQPRWGLTGCALVLASPLIGTVLARRRP